MSLRPPLLSTQIDDDEDESDDDDKCDADGGDNGDDLLAQVGLVKGPGAGGGATFHQD